LADLHTLTENGKTLLTIMNHVSLLSSSFGTLSTKISQLQMVVKSETGVMLENWGKISFQNDQQSVSDCTVSHIFIFFFKDYWYFLMFQVCTFYCNTHCF